MGISYTAVTEVVTTTEEYAFTKGNVFLRRRNNLKLPNTCIECIWIEITVYPRKFLLGTFYRPQNSPAQTLSFIEDSIGLVFDSNINGPRREKTRLRGVRQSEFQTSLLSYRD